MQIEVQLYGQLIPHMQRRQSMTLERVMNVHEVASRLGLNLDEVGLIIINNEQKDFQDLVPPRCRLCFFPYMVGG